MIYKFQHLSEMNIGKNLETLREKKQLNLANIVIIAIILRFIK